VFTANYGKIGETKDRWKDRMDEGIAEGRTITLVVYSSVAEPGDPYQLCFGNVRLNGGGTVHGKGYLSETPILAWVVKGEMPIFYDAAGVVPWLDQYDEGATTSLVFWEYYPPFERVAHQRVLKNLARPIFFYPCIYSGREGD